MNTTALDRLIRWAARGPYPSYPPDVIGLAALTLSWVLGSSNRFARDYTTKAIASLYIGQIRDLTTLIERRANGLALEEISHRPSYAEPFIEELKAWHAAIVDGAPVVNTVEQAGVDMGLFATFAKLALKA